MSEMTVVAESPPADAQSPDGITAAYVIPRWLTLDEQAQVRRAAKKGGCRVRMAMVREIDLATVLDKLSHYGATELM